MSKLNQITIQGFKSIQQLENFELYAMRQQCQLFDAWIEKIECSN